MRALLLQLRPVTLEDQRLGEALTSLVAELERKQVINCDLEIDDVDLPKHIENQLYRIAQEGLSNVLRHAEASKARVTLSVSGDHSRLLFVIEDDGKGFREEELSKTTMGLKSIRERTELLGGTVKWVSIPDKGTRMEVRVPLFNN